MNREDIIRMALEAGARDCANPDKWDIWNIRDTDLERFAALVAEHTLSNIDPSKLMSFQEVFEAGRVAEREPVQVPVLEFVEMVLEKEHLVGKPLVWAQWPNEEQK